MSGIPTTSSGDIDFSALLAVLSKQSDPLGYVVEYLKAQRIPHQGPFFYVHAYIALGVHSCIIATILLTTWVRSRRDQLWLTRRQQGRLRLNATVIAILFVAIYSSMAIAYTSLLLYQQRTGKYLAGSAAFQMSCFSAVSFCISVVAFTYHQSLPVGFENSFFRTLFHKQHAAADRHFFGFALLGVWLVCSLAGLMTFPIIHDYWRRRVDSNIQGIITYLERDDVRERGLDALVGIADQFSRLPHQVQRAQVALRRQLLIFIAHCGIYLVVIVPVAFKLLSLLNKQMDTLRRSAEDFFRLGTRQKKGDKATSKEQKATNATKSRPVPLTQANVKHSHSRIATPQAAVVVCSNCSHEIPVTFPPPKVERGERVNFRAVERPEIPRFDLHPDFPLQKLKRLKRVRLELAGFSAIIIFGLANFMAWICVAYGSAPSWSSSDLTANLFVISFWCYAVPCVISSVFYAYTTAALQPPSAPASTSASQRSGPTKSSYSSSAASAFWQRLPFFGKRRQYRRWHGPDVDQSERMRIIQNKRSRPTFPRVASAISFGAPFTPAAEMEIIAVGKEYEYPQVKSSVETIQWVENQKETASRSGYPRVPSPSLKSRSSLKSLRPVPRKPAPANPTFSWLDTDED